MVTVKFLNSDIRNVIFKLFRKQEEIVHFYQMTEKEDIK